MLVDCCFQTVYLLLFCSHSTLSGFCADLVTVINCLRVERDHRALLVVQKRPVCLFPVGSLESRLLQVVTPYAFALMKPHIDSFSLINIERVVDDSICEIICNEGILSTSISTCTCLFRSSTGLLCKHILAVRHHKLVDLFDVQLVSDRWTRAYYLSNHLILRNGQFDDASTKPTVNVTAVMVPKSIVLTAHQKFRTASIVANELATLISEVPTRHFANRLDQLKKLCQAWKANQETSIQVLQLNAGDAITNENIVADISDDVAGVNELINTFVDNAGDVNSNVEVVEEDAVDAMISVTNAVVDDAVVIANLLDGIDDAVIVGTNVAEDCTAVVNNDVVAAISVVANVTEYAVATDPIASPLSLAQVNLPARTAKRGRPKGADKTVIGLPKKKKRYNKVIPFKSMSVYDKEKKILLWIVGEAEVTKVLSGILVEEESVEVRPDYLSKQLLDINVELELVHRYFTRDAWLALNSSLRILRADPTYFCDVCRLVVSDDFIICDCCLEWLHMHCVGLRKPPKKKYWYCKSCATNNDQGLHS